MNEALIAAISKARTAVHVAQLCSQQADIIRHAGNSGIADRFAAFQLDQRALMVAIQGISSALDEIIAWKKKEIRAARKKTAAPKSPTPAARRRATTTHALSF